MKDLSSVNKKGGPRTDNIPKKAVKTHRITLDDWRLTSTQVKMNIKYRLILKSSIYIFYPGKTFF